MNLKFSMFAWLRLFETHAPNIISKVPEKGPWSTCDVKKWAAHCICVIGIYVQLCTYHPGKSVKNCRKMPRKNTSLVGSGGEERVILGAATNKLCGKKTKEPRPLPSIPPTLYIQKWVPFTLHCALRTVIELRISAALWCAGQIYTVSLSVNTLTDNGNIKVENVFFLHLQYL